MPQPEQLKFNKESEKPPEALEVKKAERLPETPKGLIELGKDMIEKIKKISSNLIDSGIQRIKKAVASLGGEQKEISQGMEKVKPVQNEILNLTSKTKGEIQALAKIPASDNLERIAGGYPSETIPKIISENSTEIEIARKKEEPEITPILTFLGRLNENRRRAVKIIYGREEATEDEIRKLLESSDFIERIGGVRLLREIPNISDEKILLILKEKINDENKEVRKAVINSLLSIGGEKAFSILEEMKQDKDVEIRDLVAKAKIQISVDFSPEKALLILEEMKNYESAYQPAFIRRIVPLALAKFAKSNERALSMLKEMRNDNDWLVRKRAENLLAKLDQKSFDIEKIVAQFKAEIGSVQDEKTSEKVKEISMKIIKSLAAPNPVWATLFPEETREKILEVQRVIKQLKKEYGDKIVGSIILGSIARGSAIQESDIDIALLATDHNCYRRFIELATDYNLNLCRRSQIHVALNENYQLKNLEQSDILFEGLFLGDYKKLLEIQKELLESIDGERWERIREKIMYHETALSKTKQRFQLSQKEIDKLFHAILFIRVPPLREETLKNVMERIEKMRKKNNFF